jgi:prepilin-type N-terminal cleavage/methylation domain-containing protein
MKRLVFEMTRQHHRCRAFSLIEVIAAVAIFAIGMTAILGLFAPITKSVAAVSDAEAAARAADAVRARLQGMPFDAVLALVQDASVVRRNDGSLAYNPNTNPAVLYAKVSGDLGIYDASEGKRAWYDSSLPAARKVEDYDKFFEIDLIRDDSLTPKSADATAAMVAYTMRIRWPAFYAASSGAAVQVGANPGGGAVPFDQSKKQVLFFGGAIRR